MFIINKYDLVQDEEILEEYKSVLYKDIISFLEKKRNKLKIDEDLIDKNTVVMSAVTHVGVDEFLDKII